MLSDLKKQIDQKSPESLIRPELLAQAVFTTGLEGFDQLFPSGGIPYGQLIELTGQTGSGKTGLLWHIIAALTKQGRVAYVDSSDSLFPTAAKVCGVNLERLIIARPDSVSAAARTTELLLQHKLCRAVVCDLVRLEQPRTASDILNIPWCHRLRSRTVRARGMVIFVTENNSAIIPPSMVSLRLETVRKDHRTIIVTATKSRICPEGVQAEVMFDG